MGQIVNDFRKYGYFLKELVVRDFKKKYYKSVLGILWTILNPLLTMLVMTLIFSTLFKRAIENYPIYLLCGNLMFGLFRESANGGMHSITGNAGMIKKVSIPGYFFCISRVILATVNFGFSFLSMILIMLFLQVKISWTILLIPVPIVLVFLFSLGMGLALGSMAVYFRDLEYLFGVVMTLWHYLTPLFYPISIIPEKWLFIWYCNPMFHYVNMFRDLVYIGTIPPLETLLYGISFAWVMLLIGIVLYKKLKGGFFLHF